MSAATAPTAFEILDPLPSGTTLLEASAGTGKTWTIAALVTRFVAEGSVELRDALLVTFGRAATRELRERVRERLTEARDALAPERRAGAAEHGDPVVRWLAKADAVEVAARHDRLTRATADLDAATVVTTHRFCQLVIQGLGSAAGADPGTELVEDIGELVEEVAGDLYLRKWAAAGEPDFGWKDALAIARAAAFDSHATLVPAAAEGVPAIRARFADAVRREVANRLQARRAMSFDDLLAHLRNVLAHPNDGPLVAERLRSRYRLVLVDEFQDTDPVQWEILHAAFHGHSTLVLIGDPKQAIYAFRGGDVQSYLAASTKADRRATLATNWRSDPGLLRGLDALFAGSALGDDRIAVAPVLPGRDAPLLTGPAPVRLRVLPSASANPTQDGLMRAPEARRRIAEDLADEVVARLTADDLLSDAPGVPGRPIEPGDIAVLVQKNAQAEQVRDALVAVGVPAVLRATSNVFATSAAADWAVLLEALEQPHRTGRVRRLAVTAFVGSDARKLADGGDDAHDLLAERVRSWGDLLATAGVAALFTAVDAAYGTTARLLGQRGGERALTDLRHVADVLHQASVAQGLGPAALLTWLRRRIAEADRPDTPTERSRRLDSDAAAVQIVTVHSSKGLEFPLVFVPFAWDRWPKTPEIALFHDPSGARCRDVGGPDGPGWSAALRAHRQEDAGEDLRLFYVAATRARCSLTLWWARSSTTAGSALHRLLFGATAASSPPEQVAPPQDDAAALHVLTRRLRDAAGDVAVVPVTPRAAVAWTVPAGDVAQPRRARFDRTVETDWRRTSYSGLTAVAHDRAATPAPADLDADGVGTVDEPEAREGNHDEPAAHPPAPPFAVLPGGAAFGTLVHEVLERVDPAGGFDELLEACTAAMRYTPIRDLEPAVLAQTLGPVLHTPLGLAADGLTLAELGTADRLCELEFELPLLGGDVPAGTLRLGELAAVLDEGLPADDPVRSWVPRLTGPDLAGEPLIGYLTGSIDVVLRVGDGADTRYLVVDYKTNRLHPQEVEPTLWYYRSEAMAAAMHHADYPLQALLYQVALHRYLTWRHPGYDPERQLGGALYLFLRGMPGPAADGSGDVPGVFAWTPPPAVVVACSELLAKGTT
ncbi:MAG: UvrD-helicase domain-containing protein [Sporichthyaceae bacterium]